MAVERALSSQEAWFLAPGPHLSSQSLSFSVCELRTYVFIQQIFIEDLLYARHCSSAKDMAMNKNKTKNPSLMELTFYNTERNKEI